MDMSYPDEVGTELANINRGISRERQSQDAAYFQEEAVVGKFRKHSQCLYMDKKSVCCSPGPDLSLRCWSP